MRTPFAALIALVICTDCSSKAPWPTSAAPTLWSPPIVVAESRVPSARAEPRVTMTASDGTGLLLRRLGARAVVDEPLALTEMTMAFENPEDRILEGTFRFTLPQGASVSRFAMRVGEAWQEGEVVELHAARRAYEDFLHRKQDPALLEQAAGSEFSARVFPIPAHGTKEVIVSYSQEIPAGASYTLPLRGLPEVESLDVELTRAGKREPEVAFHRERAAPDDVALPPGETSPDGLSSGELVLARVRPEIDAAPEPITSAIILLDTSASRSLGFADELGALTRIVSSIVSQSGVHAQIDVACFDQTVDRIFEGEAGSFGARELARIQARGALGASDIDRALAWARRGRIAGGFKRVILVTDGVATAGVVADDALVADVRALGEVGVERMDAVAVGGIRDDAVLRRVVTAGLDHDGVVADGGLDEPSLGRRLALATRSGIAVKVEGATWWWPRTLDGVQPGDERSVYAEVPGRRGGVRLDVGGTTSVPNLRSVERPLLERGWAQAKITSLLDERASKGGADPDVAKEIVKLSLAHRVVSPYTAMIVLETEYDYARFNIDRHALANILTIDHGAISVADRHALGSDKNGGIPQATATSVPAKPPSPGEASAASSARGREDNDALSARGNMWGAEIGDAFGAGGLGLTGVGEGGGGGGGGGGEGISPGAGGGTGQGFGSSHGRVGAVHVVRAPVLRAGATTVSGRLPPEVIQRIVRQNFGRFRACYEQGLLRNRGLTGRVSVRFSIDHAGTVTQAVDGGSDLPDTDVVACVARSFTELSFPEPAGGEVTVVYPIVFSPEGADADHVATPTSPEPVPWHRSVAPSPPAPPSAPPPKLEPYTGRFKEVMNALGTRNTGAAYALAFAWHEQDPGDVLALVALGESLEAVKDVGQAARAYGSVIDLFPARADLRRFAGERLERLAGGAGLDLAIDTYSKANDERPDHPSSHRLLAFALLQKGLYSNAFDAGVAGLAQKYPPGRFAGVDRVLREDLGLIGAAWAKAEPGRRAEILKRVTDMGGTVESEPSLRFLLTWETDANDVDFHIFDAKGGHAYYRSPKLGSGGSLYADVTTGYGPECFTIRGPRAERAGPYTLQANYYSRGPMGYGMGKLEIIDHDGAGNLKFEERPYVVMADGAFVDLGVAQ
jgi:hypothetical protein